MRTLLLILFSVQSAFACAFQGTIVEKNCHPVPNASMGGTYGFHAFLFRGVKGVDRCPIMVPPPEFWAEETPNAICRFILRDRNGTLHSQMVTPEVYARYPVGCYFNDLQPGPSCGESKDFKSVKRVSRLRGHSSTIAQRTGQHRHRLAKSHHRAHHDARLAKN